MNASAAPTATTAMSDGALVDAVRAGEESAFEELYRRYGARVLSFVQRRVRDEGRAEDLTQEAFLSALRRLRETESEVAFRPWIHEIARNATIDHFRRRARSEEVSVDSVDDLRPGDQRRLVGDRGPERELAAKQQLETLCGAFAELSDRHERILVMRELEGLSYRQIGEQMELTRPSVESTLFRARRRLEREFGDLETGRRCLASRGAMGRLAEGLELRDERNKVERHVRRCTACRATARELGLALGRPTRAARAAALIPLPAFLVRRLGASSGQGAELVGAIGAKGTALVAALALAGGGAGAGAVSVNDTRDRGTPGEHTPSAFPRSGHREAAPTGPAPASPKSPARGRPAAAAARRRPSSKRGAREGQAPSAAPALRGLEPR
ncbi:MAG: sigma-70 family RNA polymerase sigma factor, partial [Actinomycetota bacterium]|nr:sigma-70 family RNA polymerase sigma factor [Actinomycetota bacterium]